MNINKKVIIGSLIGCIFGATVGYSTSVVSLPHTFTAGTPIKASEVNANFSSLAQEILNIKNTVNLNKSSDFSEAVVSPLNATVGSTVMVGSKSFIIKQKMGLEDLITGKKYTLNYPEPTSGANTGFVAINCKGFSDGSLIVRGGIGEKFTSYVSLFGRNYVPGGFDLQSQVVVVVYIQLTNNLCAYVETERNTDYSHATASQMIDTAVEIQRYISVQAL